MVIISASQFEHPGSNPAGGNSLFFIRIEQLIPFYNLLEGVILFANQEDGRVAYFGEIV